MSEINYSLSNDDSTEKKILQAAREVFVESGLAGARMQAIADRAGVNKALLHYYFRSKEKLYQAALKEYFELFWKYLEKEFVPGQEIATIELFVQTVVRAHITIMRTNPLFPKMIIREIADGGENFSALIGSLHKKYGSLPIHFFNLINLEIKNGKLRPIEPIHVLLNILGMCVITFLARPIIGSISKILNKSDDFDEAFYEKRIESIISTVLDGIRSKE